MAVQKRQRPARWRASERRKCILTYLSHICSRFVKCRLDGSRHIRQRVSVGTTARIASRNLQRCAGIRCCGPTCAAGARNNVAQASRHSQDRYVIDKTMVCDACGHDRRPVRGGQPGRGWPVQCCGHGCRPAIRGGWCHASRQHRRRHVGAAGRAWPGPAWGRAVAPPSPTPCRSRGASAVTAWRPRAAAAAPDDGSPCLRWWLEIGAAGPPDRRPSTGVPEQS